jgi:hypothetical protein
VTATNRAIMAELFLSEAAVKSRLRDLYTRYGIANGAVRARERALKASDRPAITRAGGDCVAARPTGPASRDRESWQHPWRRPYRPMRPDRPYLWTIWTVWGALDS